MSQSDTLTRGQQKALRAMLCSTSIVEVAERAGVSRRTVYRYLQCEAFRSELRRRQDEVLSGVTGHLVGLAEVAVSTLFELMTDKKQSGATRVRAAIGWLRFVRETVELNELAARVRRLEEFTAQ